MQFYSDIYNNDMHGNGYREFQNQKKDFGRCCFGASDEK